ncbi:MAG: hypothetical protein R6T87_04740 [Marinobacter sp.]
MNLNIHIKALTVWLGIVVLAIANGLFREAVLIPAMSKPAGLVLSGLLLSGLILAVAYLALPWFGRRAGAAAYAAVGVGWLCLTLLFEFTFGRIVQDKPWPELFEAYTFKDGNIWPVVLLVTALAPNIAAKIRGW